MNLQSMEKPHFDKRNFFLACSDSVWCDGGCLDPFLVCDGKEDCSTGDDEIECGKVSQQTQLFIKKLN